MNPLRVVQIGRGDLLGGRFNGFSIRHLLADRGIDSRYLVYSPRTTDPLVERALPWRGSDAFVALCGRLERRLSVHSLLQLHSFGLPLQRSFRQSAVAHYHVIHDGFFSILAMPRLARSRPSIWTWHDPWMMTGHCIYPMDCGRWRTGCGNCPDLSLPFQMREDRTALNFRVKKKVAQKTSMDIVLASKWMMDMAAASPIGEHTRRHLIPFGIDLKRFSPEGREAARARFGVTPGNVVIAVRGQDSPFKGSVELARALEMLDAKTPITLLVAQDAGHFDHMLTRHQIITLPWMNGEEDVAQVLRAADIFAMPSMAEAFGMMAIEAMAAGCTVVVFEGTSLPEVTHAPRVGVAVPRGDCAALASAISRLVDDPAEREARARLGRDLAEAEYGEDLFVDRMAALYREVAARHRTESPT